MMRQQRQNKNEENKRIAPQQVWPSLTEEQQAQLVQTIKAICQQLTSRQIRQEEGDNAKS